MTNPDDGLPIVTGTLRERFTQVFIEHGTDWEDLGEDSPAGQLIEDLIEVTASWLEDDATRAVVYDGMVATGPMLANVGKSLARAARGERSEGDEHEGHAYGGERRDEARDRSHA